ncbi:MAG: hypothetical protein J6Y93_03205 [Treponema sp.]|nr:hypothetical protein [Treponema sp.]
MTDIEWPQSLPQVLILDGLRGKKKSSVIRTEMDAGPKKQRRRYTVTTKDFTGSVTLTETQRRILSDFYDSVLAGGVLRFTMKDPQTLELSEFRFTDDYDEESLDGLWKITMNLEKMNA